MKPTLTRLMKSVLRLHPLLEDEELRQAYEQAELAIGYKPKKGKCLMRNSGVTYDMVKAAFISELKRADIKYYYDAFLDWSNSNDEKKVDWIATIRGGARRDLAKGELKVNKYTPESVSNAGGKFEPEPVSETSMTREQWKQSEEYKQKFKRR